MGRSRRNSSPATFKRGSSSSNLKSNTNTSTRARRNSVLIKRKAPGKINSTMLLNRLHRAKINLDIKKIKSDIRTLDSDLGNYQAVFWRDDRGPAFFLNNLKNADDFTIAEVKENLEQMKENADIFTKDDHDVPANIHIKLANLADREQILEEMINLANEQAPKGKEYIESDSTEDDPSQILLELVDSESETEEESFSSSEEEESSSEEEDEESSSEEDTAVATPANRPAFALKGLPLNAGIQKTRIPLVVPQVEAIATTIENFLSDGDHSIPELSNAKIDQIIDTLKVPDGKLEKVYAKLLDITEKFAEDFNNTSATKKERAFYDKIRLAVYAKVADVDEAPDSVEALKTSSGEEAKGNVSQVFLARYNKLRNVEQRAVLKQIDDTVKKVTAGERLLLNREFPMILERNLGNSILHDNVKEKTGANLNIMTRTDVRMMEIEGQYQPQLMLKMELIDGVNGKDWQGRYSHLDLEQRGKIARDLTRLQYYDFLMTQMDRNIANYIIKINEQGVITGVKAIDNDFSATSDDDYKAGNKAIELFVNTDKNGIKTINGVYLMPLPAIADKTTFKFFMGMTEKDIDDVSHVYTAKQIDIMKDRLRLIQNHLSQLNETTEGIIEDDAWSDLPNQQKVEKGIDGSSETYVDLLRSEDSNRHRKIIFRE